MTQAPIYTPITDFSTDELNNVGGRSTVGTAKLDAEFSLVALTANALRSNVALLQRDDGQLRDGIVRLPSLASDVVALMVAQSGNTYTVWTTATAYKIRDVVNYLGATYICGLAHTSGVFATDAAANRWIFVAAGGAAFTSNSISYDPAFPGSVARSLTERLKTTLLISDFGSNNQTAIAAALISGAALGKTVEFSPGNYTMTDGLQIPEFLDIYCKPGVKITFTGTSNYVLASARGVNAIGNGALIECTNPAWNGQAILVTNGLYADDYPSAWDGWNIKGPVGLSQGTGLALDAQTQGTFISFVRFSNFTFHELNFGLTLDCGNTGSAGSTPTWHWINGNSFDNFNYYGVVTGISINGLPGVPAEVDGNLFTTHNFQVNGPSLICNGGTNNHFINFYHFDINYSLVDAVQFIGGANKNFIRSNVRVEGIIGSSTNYCESNIGELTGDRIFTDDVDILGYCAVDGDITSGGNLWVQGVSELRIGGPGTQAVIKTDGGGGPLYITPAPGNNIVINAEARLNGRTDPFTDNANALGRTVARWTTIHLSSAPTITSDEREKDHITEIPDAVLTAWSKVNFCQFKMHGSGKWRFGVVAQRVKEAFESEGLDPFAYGLLCFDQWDDVFQDGKLITTAGSRYGIIYEEALILECALLRKKLK